MHDLMKSVKTTDYQYLATEKVSLHSSLTLNG